MAALVKYIDEFGHEQSITEYTLVSDSDFTWGDDGNDGWYVVDSNITVEQRYLVSSDVKLILVDGVTLTVTGEEQQAGIEVVNDSNSFTVYGQVNNTGALFSTGGDWGAGIGGSYQDNSANITINGGLVTAVGGKAAAGIGGGYKGSGANITINGGTVTATGGESGAGIGGGYKGAATRITVSNGTVTATGGKNAAGIGSGEGGTSSLITVDGGTVTANGGENAAGIGGGNNGNSSEITVNGGSVTANGGLYGSGIGGGNKGNGIEITINSGSVTATGGEQAAGIGGGKAGNGSDIVINSNAVTANGGENGSGIGAGYKGTAARISVDGDILVKADDTTPPQTVIPHTTEQDISGDLKGKRYVSVEPRPPAVSYRDYQNGEFVDAAVGGDTGISYTLVTNGSGITWTAGYYVVGADYNADGVIDAADASLGVNTFTISNSVITSGDVKLILVDGFTLNVTGAEELAGIEVTGNGNSFTVYEQVNGTGALNVNGGNHGAGIGSGYESNAADITINGGKITATGGENGAGIGGGYQHNGYDITIHGGNVTANGNGAAGIGGGYNGSASSISITGGTVKATGGENGAGIGGGEKGTGSTITISGGTVTAKGGNQGAGIGGGYFATGSHITITGGDVNAKGGEQGAGIGGGSGENGSNIMVTGGDVTATGGDLGAGIGGGKNGNGSNITFADGTITANGGNSGAGIGGGKGGNGIDITVTGGDIIANGSTYSAGIGGGKGGNGSDITVTGGTVTASGGTQCNGVGGGDSGTGYDITVSPILVVRADNNNPPVTVIPHAWEEDITDPLVGQQYVTIKLEPLAGSVFLNNLWTAGEEVTATFFGYEVQGVVGDGSFFNDSVEAKAAAISRNVLLVIAGGYGTMVPHCDGINTRVEAGTSPEMFFGGQLFSAPEAGDESEVNATEVAGTCRLNIGNGTFKKSVAAGDSVESQYVTRTGDIRLIVEGGTFDKRIAGGMYYTGNGESGSATLDGSVYFTIRGGTFNGRIYAGCNAQSDELGVNTHITGDVTLKIDSSTSDIYINQHVVAGSRGEGVIDGNVSITFTGDGSNLHFADSSVVFGGCNSDFAKLYANGTRTTSTTVAGSRDLIFSDFTGDFGAELRMFKTATFKNNSAVNFTDTELDLWAVETWNFEFGSNGTNLADNDFINDTLNFDMTGFDNQDWTVLTGSTLAFDDLGSAKAVNFGMSSATYYSDGNYWADKQYKLSLNNEGTAMIVSKKA